MIYLSVYLFTLPGALSARVSPAKKKGTSVRGTGAWSCLVFFEDHPFLSLPPHHCKTSRSEKKIIIQVDTFAISRRFVQEYSQARVQFYQTRRMSRFTGALARSRCTRASIPSASKFDFTRSDEAGFSPGRRHDKQARRSNLDPTHVANSAAITGHRWFPMFPTAHRWRRRHCERKNEESDCNVMRRYARWIRIFRDYATNVLLSWLAFTRKAADREKQRKNLF